MGKIFNVYRRAFSKVFAFLVLSFFCVAASFLVVFPFYYLASLHKGIYTAMCLVLIFLLLTFLVAKKLYHLYRESRKRFFLFLFNLSIPIVAVSLFIFLALRFYRITSIIVLLSFFLLYVVLVPLLNAWMEK